MQIILIDAVVLITVRYLIHIRTRMVDWIIMTDDYTAIIPLETIRLLLIVTNNFIINNQQIASVQPSIYHQVSVF